MKAIQNIEDKDKKSLWISVMISSVIMAIILATLLIFGYLFKLKSEADQREKYIIEKPFRN